MGTENEQKVEEPIEDSKVDETPVDETPADETPAGEPKEEESTLAQDALDEASETEKPEVDPKDAVIGDFRKKGREKDLLIENLKGQIEATKPKPEVKEKEVIKSPMDLALEKAAEEQGVSVDEAEVTLTGKLNREQKAFETEQRATQTATTTKEQSDAAANTAFATAGETMNTEAMGKGLDFNTIIEQSGDMVTPEDMKWLASKSKSYADFYKRLYKFSLDAIIEAGGDNAKILQAQVKAHSQANKKIEKKPEKPEVPKRKVILETATTVGEAHVNQIMSA